MEPWRLDPRNIALLASLAALRTGASGSPHVRSLFESPYDGRAKLWVVARALALRRQHPALFAAGGYQGVAVKGARDRHVVAFRRVRGKEGVLVVAGRFFASFGLAAGELPLGERWGDTRVDASFLPSGASIENVLTGETLVVEGDTLDVAALLREFPGALVRFVGGTPATRHGVRPSDQ